MLQNMSIISALGLGTGAVGKAVNSNVDRSNSPRLPSANYHRNQTSFGSVFCRLRAQKSIPRANRFLDALSCFLSEMVYPGMLVSPE